MADAVDLEADLSSNMRSERAPLQRRHCRETNSAENARASFGRPYGLRTQPRICVKLRSRQLFGLRFRDPYCGIEAALCRQLPPIDNNDPGVKTVAPLDAALFEQI